MTDYNVEIRYSDFRIQKIRIAEIADTWPGMLSPETFTIERQPSREHCSRFIESLLIGFPPQPVYVDNTNGGWYVIEGADRIKAYIDFCNGKYPLSSLYFKMNQYEGMYFGDLSVLAKKNIRNAQIQVNVLNPGLSRQDRFGIYTCLKSRIDSDTLKACRKSIYGSQYRAVENAAEEIASRLCLSGRTSLLEHQLMHLLVAYHYQMFIKQPSPYHIDVVANVLLEKGCFEDFYHHNTENLCHVVEKVWTDHQNTSKRKRDYYMAILLFSHCNVDYDDFKKAYRSVVHSRDSLNQVEVFAQNLYQIFNRLNIHA